MKWLVVALIVVSAVWLLVRYACWRTTNFVVTSDRVIFRHGLFAKAGIEIPLERINNVHFSQGIIERILGAGDLMIESGSEQGQQRFTDVRNPDRVTMMIHKQMDVNEDKMYGDRDGVAPDAATQLEKLEGMMAAWHAVAGGVRGPEAQAAWVSRATVLERANHRAR